MGQTYKSRDLEAILKTIIMLSDEIKTAIEEQSLGLKDSAKASEETSLNANELIRLASNVKSHFGDFRL